MSGDFCSAPKGLNIATPANISQTANVLGRDEVVPYRTVLILFVVSLLIPLSFPIAGVVMRFDRLFLIISFIPLASMVYGGHCGRVNPVDWLVLAHCLWLLFAIVVHEGVGRLPFGIISAVEILGSYCAGRVLIRSMIGYRFLFKLIFLAFLVLLPLALIEIQTGRIVVADLLRPLGETPSRTSVTMPRWGLERAHVVFDHPILYGLFCSFALSNFVYLNHANLKRMGIGYGLAGWMTFMSLSAGAVLAAGLQTILMLWGWITKGKWVLFLVLSTSIFVFLNIASNRGPIVILIDTITFDPETAWIRVAINEYAWAAVMTSPVMGIGFEQWHRPSWVTSSVDNFWLVQMLRYGLPAGITIMGAFVWQMVRVSRVTLRDEELRMVRTGYVVALVASFFTLITVHIWGTVGVFVMFYLGAGNWFCEIKEETETKRSVDDTRHSNDLRHSTAGQSAHPNRVDDKGLRFTRFSQRASLPVAQQDSDLTYKQRSSVDKNTRQTKLRKTSANVREVRSYTRPQRK